MGYLSIHLQGLFGSKVATGILGPSLSYRHDDGLMVGCGYFISLDLVAMSERLTHDSAHSVGTSSETSSNI